MLFDGIIVDSSAVVVVPNSPESPHFPLAFHFNKE